MDDCGGRDVLAAQSSGPPEEHEVPLTSILARRAWAGAGGKGRTGPGAPSSSSARESGGQSVSTKDSTCSTRTPSPSSRVTQTRAVDCSGALRCSNAVAPGSRFPAPPATLDVGYIARRAAQLLDPRIDIIVREVATHYDVKICLVALNTEDGLHFMAQCGVEAEHMPLLIQTPVEVTGFRLFHHGISRDLPITIYDAARDERLKHDALVTEFPNVRFYTGAPLIYARNVYIGTLCIVDSSPRYPFTLMDAQWLEEKAAEIVAIIKEQEGRAADSA